MSNSTRGEALILLTSHTRPGMREHIEESPNAREEDETQD